MGKAKASPAVQQVMEQTRINWVRAFDALMAEGNSRSEVGAMCGMDGLRYYAHAGGTVPGLQVVLGLVLGSGGRFTMNDICFTPVDQPLPERKEPQA